MKQIKTFSKVGILVLFACLTISLIFPMFAFSDEFPSRPIKLIIPMSPGGSHDAHARAFASVAHQYFGVPVLAVIKSGGGGAIGANYVAKSKPDGYTLLFGANQGLLQKPLIESLPYSYKSFVAIGRINYSPTLIFVQPDAPYKTLKEFLAYAKEHPKKLNFGAIPGGSAQFTIEPLLLQAGAKVNLIPMRGGAPTVKAFLSRDIDFSGLFMTNIGEYIKSGRVRVLAVSSPERLPALPDVPTLIEEGFNHQYAMFRAIFAPKGIPESRLRILREGFEKTVKDKSFASIVKRMGERVIFMNGEDMEKFMDEENERTKATARLIFPK